MATTIQISNQLVDQLKEMKINVKESYETVIWDLIEDTMELNAETKKARREAHKALECAYPKAKTGTIYKNIQRLMGLSEEDAHIGKFTKEQCINLIELLNGGKG